MNINFERLQKDVLALKENRFISDGYHTFDELYEFRKVYNAALFNEWATIQPSYFTSAYGEKPITFQYDASFDGNIAKYHVHKSWKHHDGELCFGGGWFIVCLLYTSDAADE